MLYKKIIKKIVYIKDTVIQNFFKLLFVFNHYKYVAKSISKKDSILIDINWQNPIYYILQIILLSVLNSKKQFKIITFRKNKFSFPFINMLFKSSESLFYQNIKYERTKIQKIPGIHFFYDSLLKKMKLPSFDFLTNSYKSQILKKEKKNWSDQYFYFTNQIKKKKIRIAVISHFFGIYHPLVAALLKLDVKVYHLNFLNNHMQCMKFNKFDDLFSNKTDYFDVPTLNDFKNLKQNKLRKYLNDGKNYYKELKKSKKGQVSRIKVYGKGNPFFRSKKYFCDYLGLNQNKKNVIILGNCWTDFSNTQGEAWFKDYYQWFNFTLKNIKKNKKYNWLLKPHPAEHEYDGATMLDFIKKEKLPNHVKLWPKKANANDIIRSGDIIISARGSASYEHILANKKVLTADKTLYSPLKICRFCKNKSEYKNILKSIDKLKIPSGKQIKDTLLYLSIVHSDNLTKKFINNLPYGTQGLNSFKSAFNFLNNNKKKLNNELKVVKNWVNSDLKKYNTFKKIYYE